MLGAIKSQRSSPKSKEETYRTQRQTSKFLLVNEEVFQDMVVVESVNQV